ncbi:hypothetical protein Taro_003239 [Colocasia esculenta]|uniref:Jacalin-type lectin domain-containing protein n=1 Tax=Colocasia esculenta TaxID=4460 RepID=A0A843TIU6_COLES|nr:hypothetical protein [Colocasia esculenta]
MLIAMAPSRCRNHQVHGSNVYISTKSKGILIKIGPRGELYSTCEDWSEVLHGNIQHIFVTHGKAINSIQVAYEFDGQKALSHRHGRIGDASDCASASYTFTYISFDPWETLVAVSGYYGPVDETYFPAIRSLKFVTDRATYGPFGVEEGTHFSFRFDPRLTFAGFHGRSSFGYLRAIGVYARTDAKHHVEPLPSQQLPRALPALWSSS